MLLRELQLKKFCNLSNCMISKTHAITKIFCRAEHTVTLNTWRKRFIIIIILLCIETVSIMFRKTFQEKRLPILKISQNNSQNNFLNFLTSKKYFHNLTIFLGVFLKQKFVECSSNTLETMFCEYWDLPKDQHLLMSNHTLLTQIQLFYRELFKNFFPVKCSLNVPWMPGTLQRWGNILSEFSRNIACWLGYNDKSKFFFLQIVQWRRNTPYLRTVRFCVKCWYSFLTLIFLYTLKKIPWKNYVKFWKWNWKCITQSAKNSFSRKSNLNFCIIFNMISLANA